MDKLPYPQRWCDKVMPCLPHAQTCSIFWLFYRHGNSWRLSDVGIYKQTPRKLLGFYRTKDRFWPDFANIKHDYTQEFYRSYSSFISQCPRTGKFRGVCTSNLDHCFLVKFESKYKHFNQKNAFENVICIMAAILFQSQCVHMS